MSTVARAAVSDQRAWRRHLLPILTYHRIVPDGGAASACPSTVSATPEVFGAQMRAVARTRHVIGVAELLRIRRGEQTVRPGSLLLTFDDGHADFATYAWPVLRALGLPAILFVPTGQVSGRPSSFWWDRLWSALVLTDRAMTPERPAGRMPLGTPELARAAHRRLREHLKGLPHVVLEVQVDELVAELGEPAGLPRLLGWSELRGLRDEGLTVASHSVSHPLLTRVGAGRLRQELRGSLDELRKELGEVAPVLAYPAGASNDEVALAAGEAGYEIALTTRRGVNDLRRADWLRLDRIGVGSRTSTALLRAQLAPAIARLAGGLT